MGWHNKPPSQRILDKALEMKEKGLYRFLGLSGHNRVLFPRLAGDGIFDLFHIRYNAAHRGAEKETFISPRRRLYEPGAGGLLILIFEAGNGLRANPTQISSISLPSGKINPHGHRLDIRALRHSALNFNLQVAPTTS